MWNLKRVGDMKYRAVCKKGFMVFDLRARKVVDESRHPLLDAAWDSRSVSDAKNFVRQVHEIGRFC